MRLAPIVAFLLSASLGGAAGPLSNARIALRCETHELLIVGPEIGDAAIEKLGDGVRHLAQMPISVTLSPAEAIFQITPQALHTLIPEGQAGFEIGARWQIYPGAGPATTVVIEKLLLLYHGDGPKYAGAIGRFPGTAVANRIAGLSAGQYLAVPGAVVPGISEVPLIPVGYGSSSRLSKLLFDRALELVHDDKWETGDTRNPAEISRTRKINQTFLARPEFQTRHIRIWRWAPDGRKSFQFVEAVWIDEDSHLPLFAVDAVIEESDSPKILSFNYRKAQWMRMGEFSSRDWKFYDDPSAFLNAWKIGPDYFVLTYIGGIEGYSVELQRLDQEKGLVSVLSFGN